MSERHTARAAEDAANAAAVKRTTGPARRKPTTKGGAKPAADGRTAAPAAAQAPVERVAGPLSQPPSAEPRDRGLRRAIFLAELAEARELRKRVAPRRARAAELHARLLRTFRY